MNKSIHSVSRISNLSVSSSAQLEVDECLLEGGRIPGMYKDLQLESTDLVAADTHHLPSLTSQNQVRVLNHADSDLAALVANTTSGDDIAPALAAMAAGVAPSGPVVIDSFGVPTHNGKHIKGSIIPSTNHTPDSDWV